MLSSKSITATAGNAAKYYTQGDYYTKGAEETSAWLGKGAEKLGLAQASQGQDASTVSANDLTQILEGKLPEGEKHAWRHNEGTSRAHRPGRDFTFSAPKSVSVAALVGDDKRLVEAHERAVDAGVQFLERYAVARVREKGGVEHRLTENIVAAKFLEFTSRAQDAQLHTHVVIANMTFDEQSSIWRSLDYAGLESAKKAADQVYKSELARESRTLGYGIDVDEKRGFFELSAVSPQLIDDHSTRSKEIDAYVEKSGDNSSAGRAKAATLTRDNKKSLTIDKIKQQWTKRAGKAFRELTEGRDSAEARSNEDVYQASLKTDPRDHEEAFRFGAAHSTESEAVIERAEIVKNALRISVGQSTLSDIDRQFSKARENGRIVDAKEQTGGRRQYYGAYLDKDLAAEQTFRDVLKAGQSTLKPLLGRNTAERRISAFRVTAKEGDEVKSYALSDEQRTAALAILTAKDRVQHIQGVGGTGKTSFVGAVAKATPLRQHLAVSKTAVAAHKIGEEAGLEHMTIDAFLQRGGADIGKGGILFVDEGSMVGTRAATRIDQLAETNHFRVVVIGDERQLGAIEQGKPHALAKRFGATNAELKESRRHQTDAVKKAVAFARAGKVGDAIAAVDKVHVGPLDDLPSAIAAAWAKSENRDRSKILALDNKSRVAASAAVREILIGEGKVSSQDAQAQILTQHRISQAEMKRAGQYPMKDAAIVFHQGQQRHKIEKGVAYNIAGRDGDTLLLEKRHADGQDKSPETVQFQPKRDSVRGASVYDIQGRQIASGDVIQWRHNSKNLNGLKNGVIGNVRSVEGTLARIDFEDGKTREIDVARNEYWDHGYALTVYKAQGATYDSAFILAPAIKGPLLNQDTLYTALSRARYAIHVWTTDQKKLITILANEKGGKTSALEADGSLKPQRLPEQLAEIAASAHGPENGRPENGCPVNGERGQSESQDCTLPEIPKLETPDKGIMERIFDALKRKGVDVKPRDGEKQEDCKDTQNALSERANEKEGSKSIDDGRSRDYLKGIEDDVTKQERALTKSLEIDR
ncbi:MAG: MobF family relaxase [Pseudomonadota bacterium]